MNRNVWIFSIVFALGWMLPTVLLGTGIRFVAAEDDCRNGVQYVERLGPVLVCIP